MTDITAFKRLKALKTTVLADGRVDLDEIPPLLDYITPLAKKNIRFNDFKQLLVSARSDQVITKFESRTIATEIDRMIAYIKKRITISFTVTLAILASAILFFATR